MRIDHIVIFVSGDGSELEEIEKFGLKPGRVASHPGQGTSNTCYAFDNLFIELVWKINDAEIQSEKTRPLALLERTRWREEAACPFGFGLQLTGPDDGLYPFPTWRYAPDYLPAQLEPIQMDTRSNDARLPLVFFVPEYPADPNHRLQKHLGMHRVTACRLSLPAYIQATGLHDNQFTRVNIQTHYGDNYHLEIELDDGLRQRRHDFKHPNLPLSLIW